MKRTDYLPAKKLNLFLFSGTHFNQKDVNIYNKSYELWESVWKTTFLDLNGSDELFADQFCRQSKIGSFFYNEKCIAIIFFSFIDFSLVSSYQDSYFRAWPTSAVDKLVRDGKKILVASNITVHEDYRSPIINGEVSLKNLTIDLGIKILKESDCSAMTGTMRCNRGMSKAAAACGAVLLESNISLHNCSVDLVSFYSKEANFFTPTITEQLWSKRTDLENQPIDIRMTA